MMARKTNAATSLDGFVHTATGDNVTNYAGAAGTNALRVWRAGLAVTEVPARVRQTTSSAVTAESQSSSGLHLKGLPASQSGLLLPGDPVEVDSQIKIVTAPLDTDAAGLGYLQFKPQLPRSIANNTPVFINEPMCKMIMMDEPVESAHPGGFSDFEFEFVQDLS
jgi:hypothetical protein